MENDGNLLPPLLGMYVRSVMTSSEKVEVEEFLFIINSCHELPKFASLLTSDLDLFIKIIRDDLGMNRFRRIFGISDDVNTIFFYPIMMKFTEIMTHESGYDFASHVLSVCNIHHKKLFCSITFRHALVLARDDKGCIILKKVITIADDFYKDEFLDLITDKVYKLSMDDLGISLIEHVLKLDFTRKTTENDMRLHVLMAEFDENLSTSSYDHLHKLVEKLTSDPDLFVKFVKTRRGTLMFHIILGKSEETDTVVWAAIKQRFTDITTDFQGGFILLRTMYVFKKRGNLKVYDKILRQIGLHALYLTKDIDMGNTVIQHVLNLFNYECTTLIAIGLHYHYIELSFLKHGSQVVEKLLGGDNKTVLFSLLFIVIEILKCDKDTLVRLAKDEYGNGVLRKTLEIAKLHRNDLFGDLVEKLKPFLDRLRGSSLGNNIAAIIDPAIETVKDQIVSEGNA